MRRKIRAEKREQWDEEKDPGREKGKVKRTKAATGKICERARGKGRSRKGRNKTGERVKKKRRNTEKWNGRRKQNGATENL